MKNLIFDLSELESIQEELVNNFFNDNKLNFELIFTSDYENTRLIRNLVVYLCDNFKIDTKVKGRLVLIVDELNNNAIEYGSNAGEKNKMRFDIEKKDDKFSLKLEVEDTGHGKDSKKSNEMYKIENEKLQKNFALNTSIRGRGILIIKNIVNELYFKDSENGGLIVGVEYVF